MSQARGAGRCELVMGRLRECSSNAANAWERTKVAWGQPFALAEQFNRRSTFIASYRLARSRAFRTPLHSRARRCWIRSLSIPRQ
jgi:hypothetical protein